MGVNCPEIWKEISDYLDGELETLRRAELESHVEACPRCSSVLAGTRNVIHLYGDERMLEAPATLHSGVRRLISARTERRRGSAWGLFLSLVTAGAMAVLLVNANLHQTGAASLSPMSQSAIRPLPQVVQAARPGRLFHVKGCPYLHGTGEMIPLEVALGAGMAPCARCLGEYLPHPMTEHEAVEAEAYLADGSW